MQGHFVEPRVQVQHMALGLKGYGLSVRVVGELSVPQPHRSIHVEGELPLLRLVLGELRGQALHLGGQGLPFTLLEEREKTSLCDTDERGNDQNR